MISRNLSGVFYLIFFISIIGTLATQTSKLSKRTYPNALYAGCRDADVKEGCELAFNEVWSNGKIKKFTPQRQTFTNKWRCRITWWSQGSEVRINDDQKSALDNALQQIDNACTAIGQTKVNQKFKGGKGVYVGKMLGEQYLVLVAETVVRD
ncbi:hypothetical protein BY996DRAFT_7159442 [Phakopsora pachyrhizi]|nr:hypothetical protein BY996DRAFT_7159442 [Phakopsora pachyrhizi]